MENIKNKIEYGTCLKYSFGGIGFSMTNMIVLTYLTFFCTDIFGIDSLTVAGLMLITKVIDAITDPIMGFIADHTKTKWGRYRPYLMFGAPLLGLTIYLLFSAPNLSESMKVVYIYVVYISYSLAFTVVGVPFTALVPIMGNNSMQRATIISWKNIMIQVGRTIITVFSLPIVEIFGGGKIGWERYGILVGVMITICFFIVAWGAKPYDIVRVEKEKKKVDWKAEVNLIIKNKSLLMLMIAFGTDMIANSSLLAANMYYFKYVLNRADLVPITSLSLTVTGVISNFFLPNLVKKKDKKFLYWWGSCLAIIPLGILLFKPIVSVNILLTLIIIYGLVSALPTSLAWVMLSDCTDYSEYITGIEGSGVVSSTFAFVNKICGAIGASITSLAVGMVGFVANQAQTEKVILTIVILRFGTPILGYLASLASMYFYDLTEDKMTKVRIGLEERKVSEIKS